MDTHKGSLLTIGLQKALTMGFRMQVLLRVSLTIIQAQIKFKIQIYDNKRDQVKMAQ